MAAFLISVDPSLHPIGAESQGDLQLGKHPVEMTTCKGLIRMGNSVKGHFINKRLHDGLHAESIERARIDVYPEQRLQVFLIQGGIQQGEDIVLQPAVPDLRDHSA